MRTALSQRMCAWAVLVAFTSSFALGWTAASHQDADGDGQCEQIELVDGHPRVQFEAAQPLLPATHCTFCHWQRAVSGAKLSAVLAGNFQLRLLERRVPPGSRTSRPTARDQQSSRGPPTSHI